jgi:DNA gyrase subunit A
LIDHPDATVVDLMQHVPGPDFPTGAIIFGREGCRQALETGRGIIRVRARARIERDENRDRESIIVTEIPYQVNKAKLIEKIAELVQEKRIEGISDLRDESDRDGMRIFIELKRDAHAGVVMNQLYKLTPMQSTFGVIQLAIVQGQPKVLSLKEMLSIFVDHRRDVVTRRTRYELREAEKRLHILEGLKIALDNLDAVIELIKKSASPQVARERLGERFALSEIQAQAILDMKLQRLTGLEREKILEEHRQVALEIARLKAILASEELLTSVVKGEIVEMRDKYGDKRRTEIVDAVAEIALEDMIVEEDMVVTISHSGYIKRNALSLYRSQKRGGRGATGMGMKEEDFVVDLFVASTKSYVLIFTTSGRLFWLKVHEIPEGGRAARGKAIVNLLKLEPGEKQAAIVPVRAFEEGKNVVMATRRGIVKKTDLMAYSNPRPSGIIGVLIEEGDALIDARLTDGTKDIFIGTADGMSIRFEEAEVRATGRAAYGVRGIALGEGDEVVAMDIVNPGASILTVTEHGFGKRTLVEEYRQQGRAGSGVITIKTSERNGRVVGVAQVTNDDQVMLITSGGQVIRTRVAEIRESGRNTQGVTLINVSEGEKVVAVARLAESDGDADEAPPEKPVVEA